MAWLRRTLNALRAGRVERDIDREVAFHLAEREDQLRAEGLSPPEAARRARAQFGNPTLQAERARDADVAGWADALLRNLRYSLRTLSRTPGFTVTVALTLALGIGANTAVFSALDTVLFRPLPFPEADRLVEITQRRERTAETHIAPPRLADWSRLNSTFSALTGYYMEDVSDTSGELPERLRRAIVAPQFLEVMGVEPALGRDFVADEYRFGGRRAVLVSDRYWRRRLAADPRVLDKTVRIGTVAIPVIGVMPASFRFPHQEVDLWFPAQVDAPFAQSRQATWYTGVARLRPGVTIGQSRDNLAAVQARLAQQYPDSDRDVTVAMVPLKETTVRGAASSLWLLFGAVSVLLLIACTNIAALLLSRAVHRRHEITVRLSLGASRATIVGQLVAETAVLTAMGGALGLLLAAAASQALRSVVDLPRFDEIRIDGRILVYTMGTTMVVTLLCGVMPAVRAVTGLGRAGTHASRGQVSAHSPMQWLLVGAQVALSVTLLAAAGLLVRSFQELWRVHPGFDPAHVLAFRVSGSWSETSDLRRLTQRIDRTIEELRSLPGVQAAATTGWALPGVPEQWEATFALAEASADPNLRIVAEGRVVSPEYFSTMRIPLQAGELCRRRAAAGAPSGGELMVNGTFAARYLSDRPAVIGLHLKRLDASPPPARIAGIVGDARERGLHEPPGPTVYICASAPNPTPYFLVRTEGDPRAMVSAVRLQMKALEPLRSVYDIAPLDEQLGEAFSEVRLRAVVVTLFAATALSLACVGLYGTVSYVVSLRRREVGLRLALGATRPDIVRHFLAQGMRVAVAACACGLGLSLATARLLSGLLHGVSASDPATLAGVAAVALTVAALAALIPATRAALVQPMQVLRDQ